MVDASEPNSTPILTPVICCVASAKAKFPTNKLIVNPIPVKIPTPYKFNQFELLGICANLSLMDIYEKTKTPNCLPTNNPKTIPNGTLLSNEDSDNPSNETPALANANSGIIPNAT